LLSYDPKEHIGKNPQELESYKNPLKTLQSKGGLIDWIFGIPLM
jgi:hypothetical protein